MLAKLQQWVSTVRRSGARARVDPPAPVQVTPAAAAEVRRLRAELGWPVAGLRLRARSGCGGLRYEVRLAAAPAAGERILAASGVPLFADEASASVLAGASIDFVRSLRAAGFRIEHPAPPRACGRCGRR